MNANTTDYLDCLIWSETLMNDMEYEGDTYREGSSLEDIILVCDLPESIRTEAAKDLENFASLCESELGFDPFLAFDGGQVAHDFCLSRNGHGAGFFDGDYTVGEMQYCDDLQKLAKTFGTIGLDVWTDDSGKLQITSHD